MRESVERQLHDECVKLRGGLNRLEWAGVDEGGACCCPVCRALCRTTHEPNCWLDKLLAEQDGGRDG